MVHLPGDKIEVMQVQATFRKELIYMIYVGIDVASTKHDICIMSQLGITYSKIFQIKNLLDEYKKLLNKIDDAKKFFKDSKVRIGIESTGSYSSTLVNYLANFPDFEVIYINPILTNKFQLSQSIHYAKTDSIDAEGICKFLIKNPEILTYTPPSYQKTQLKSLYRELMKLNKLKEQASNRLHAMLHITFPEIFTVFKDILAKGVLILLNNYPLPSSFKGIHKSTITSLLKDNSNGRFSSKKAKDIINVSKTSIGYYSEADALIIKILTDNILMFKKQRDTILHLLKQIDDEEYNLLLSIPGVGINTACGIIGEIGNINNFKNPNALLAYAGLNPLVYQSGKYEAKHTSISKKGSKYLRNALIQVSRNIIIYNYDFNLYYKKKISEGKSYNCSIGHISKKLVRVIFYILKHKTPYKLINQ